MKLMESIREARRQRRRPALVVRCPQEPREQTIAIRSFHGPMCSCCGALIDESPSHTILGVWRR